MAKIKQKNCLIISASNIQNIRIRLALFNLLNDKFTKLNFCGDSNLSGFDNHIVWKDAYNRKGKLFEIVIFFRLVVLFLKYRPTHIISFAPKVNIYCGILTRIFNIKHAAVISGLGSYVGSITKNGSILNRLFRLSLIRSDLVLTMNEFNYHFCKSLLGVDRVRRIPSEGLQTKVKVTKRKPDNSKVRILYLSRIISEKGIFLLLEAFNQIQRTYSGIELVIAGEMGLSEDNDERSVFFEKIKSPGINYQGEVSEEVKVDLLNQSDIVVLASMYGEGLPMILLEAQLHKSIIITTNVPGCNDAVSPVMRGFYCNYTVESLESKLELALSLSSEQIQEMTQLASLWVVDNHDIDYVNALYDSYFMEKLFYTI